MAISTHLDFPSSGILYFKNISASAGPQQSHLLQNSLMEMRYHLPHLFSPACQIFTIITVSRLSSYISCQTCCRWRRTEADSKVQEANQKFQLVVQGITTETVYFNVTNHSISQQAKKCNKLLYSCIYKLLSLYPNVQVQQKKKLNHQKGKVQKS